MKPTFELKTPPWIKFPELSEFNSTKELHFLFFWKPKAQVVDESCFSQWQPSPFQVNAYNYSCAEQYMIWQRKHVCLVIKRWKKKS